jgi:hypothetical protein
LSSFVSQGFVDRPYNPLDFDQPLLQGAQLRLVAALSRWEKPVRNLVSTDIDIVSAKALQSCNVASGHTVPRRNTRRLVWTQGRLPVSLQAHQPRKFSIQPTAWQGTVAFPSVRCSLKGSGTERLAQFGTKWLHRRGS